MTRRVIAASVLTGVALLGSGPAALAAEPVTDQASVAPLDDKYQFAPLGVPIFGLIESVSGVPKRLVPTLPDLPTLP